MDTLSKIVTAAHRRAMILVGGFVGTSILLALLLGSVISWSFILPVREAQAPRPGCEKGTSARPSTCRIGTNSAPWPLA